VLQHRFKLFALEKSFARIVRFELADVRLDGCLAALMASVNTRDSAASSLLMVELAAFCSWRKATKAVTLSEVISMPRYSPKNSRKWSIESSWRFIEL
jgi:hypothetical protein